MAELQPAPQMAPEAAAPLPTDSAVPDKDVAPSTSLKRPASAIEDSATTDGSTPDPEASTSAGSDKPSKPAPKVKKPRHMNWDVALEKLRDGVSPFQEKLPVEVADLILGSEVLNIRDHLALASTCKFFRNAYQADDLWPALSKHRCLPGRGIYTRHYGYVTGPEANVNEEARIWKIMSAAKPVPPTGVVVVADRGPVTIDKYRTTYAGKKVKKTDAAIEKERATAEANRHYVVLGKGQDAAIREVNSDARINKSDSKAQFKVSDSQLAALAHIKRSNFGSAPRQLFLVAAVEALALRAHGGPDGHKAHLQKVAATAEKVKATKTKNGTLPKKKPGARRSRWGLSYFYGFDDMYDDYDDYPYGGGCACGECGYDDYY